VAELVIDNFFDFQEVFINTLFGDLTLFIIVSLLIILIISAKYQLPWQATYIMIFLFIAVIVAGYANQTLWVFLVLIVGAVFYFGLSKLLQQN